MYRKNVAGQHLPFVLVSATDGTALTGATVTAQRSIDGGAQAAATGTLSELGDGQYNLALSQADVNGNQIGILLTATGAIPAHFTLLTTAADPTDAAGFGLSRLDATVGSRATQTSVDDLPTNAELATALAGADDAVLAAIAALNDLSQAEAQTAAAAALTAYDPPTLAELVSEIDAVQTDIATRASQASVDAIDDFLDTEVAAILADTNELQTDWADGGRLDLILDARASQASVDAIDDLLDTEVAAILADTNELQTDWANGGRLDNILDARASQASVDDLPTNAELSTALAAADDAVLAAIAALNNLSAAQVNAEVLDVLGTDVQSEIGSIPAAATTLINMWRTIYAFTTNELRETSNLQTLRNRANSATIGTAATSDDLTTAVRGSFS